MQQSEVVGDIDKDLQGVDNYFDINKINLKFL